MTEMTSAGQRGEVLHEINKGVEADEADEQDEAVIHSQQSDKYSSMVNNHPGQDR